MTSPDDVIERLIAELRSDFPAQPDCWQEHPPAWAVDPFNETDTAKCGYCGSWLEVVRPGKSQCPACGDDFDRANRWKAASALQDNASLIKTLREERISVDDLLTAAVKDYNDALEALTQAVETEREECAKVADKLFAEMEGDDRRARSLAVSNVADLIRSRSTQDAP